MEKRIVELEDIAYEAGLAIMSIYREGPVEFKKKADASPVTKADLLANDIICTRLRSFSKLPIISEEGSGDVQVASDYKGSYWLVDPLDGTKEFIARRPTFTVNIALIENGVPVAGVVYAPDLDQLYAGDGAGLRINRKLFNSTWPSEAVAVCSASHTEESFKAFELKNSLNSVLPIGSSIKFCLIASGQAHFYPRYQALSAWDIAAGHAVALAAGCRVTEIETGKALRYSYGRRWSPGFIVQAPGFEAEL